MKVKFSKTACRYNKDGACCREQITIGPLEMCIDPKETTHYQRMRSYPAEEGEEWMAVGAVDRLNMPWIPTSLFN